MKRQQNSRFKCTGRLFDLCTFKLCPVFFMETSEESVPLNVLTLASVTNLFVLRVW